MPCEYESSWEREKRLREAADSATRMLCTLCQVCEEAGVQMPEEVAGWWLEHQRADREREQRERERSESAKRHAELIMSACSKLTRDELKALGLSK